MLPGPHDLQPSLGCRVAMALPQLQENNWFMVDYEDGSGPCGGCHALMMRCMVLPQTRSMGDRSPFLCLSIDMES